MPNQNTPDRLGYVPMDDAPGADINFDDLFPPEGFVAQESQPPAPEQNPPVAPQAPSGPFLKAGNTVYLTAEDAVRGTEHKDQLIDRYRTYLKDNGVDPNTFQRLAPEPQAPQPTQKVESQPSPYTYYGNSKRFYDDTAKAVAAQNHEEFERINSVHTREAVREELQQYAPILAEVTRQRAVRQVSQEIPDFDKFYGSEDFRRVQERVPLAREAVQIAETNPQAAEQLNQLYKLLYFANRGMNAGSVQPQAQQPVVPATPPTVRPTLNQGSLTPPSPTPNYTSDWSQMGRDELKRFIEEKKAKLGNVNFNDVGL